MKSGWLKKMKSRPKNKHQGKHKEKKLGTESCEKMGG